MTGDVEALGDAATAALTGAALSDHHGGAATRGDAVRCRNCGTPLVGSHCHRCGQSAHVHRSFGAIGHDLLHAVLHFEGKLWNTLPLLVWRPGDLTRRYIHGERARFISPLSLFLFAVFLTYAVVAVVGSGARQPEGFDVAEAAKVQSQMNGAREQIKAKLADIDRQIAAAPEAKRAELRADRDAVLRSAALLGLIDAASAKSKGAAAISEQAGRNFVVTDIKSGIPFIDKGIKKANDNPSLLIYKLQANAYKFAWALIPLSMPFLWLLFPFSRRFHLYDHFVFITYSISFMMLFAVTLRLLDVYLVASENWIMLFMIYAPFHIYRQLRGAYRSSRFGALVRTALLIAFCMIIILLFTGLLLALGVMG